MAKLVMLSAGKAGTGRSTTTRALLVAAARAGVSAIGIDTDRQQTLTKWAQKRAALIERMPGSFAPVEIVWVEFANAEREINRISKDKSVELIVLDTPPTIEDALATNRNLILRADLVLVPTSDTADDTDSVIPWIKELVRDKAKVQILMNRVNRAHKTFGPAQAKLLKAGALVPVVIPQHADIPAQHAAGLTVLDIARMKGVDAFEGLFAHVRREIGL